MPEMKYYFYKLTERNGEFEYLSTGVIPDNTGTPKQELVWKIAKAEREFEDSDFEQFGMRGWYFNGEVACKVDSIVEITKEEFDILAKFI